MGVSLHDGEGTWEVVTVAGAATGRPTTAMLVGMAVAAILRTYFFA